MGTYTSPNLVLNSAGQITSVTEGSSVATQADTSATSVYPFPTTTQSIPNTTLTTLTYAVSGGGVIPFLNPGGIMNVTSGVWTAPVAGIYLITASCHFQSISADGTTFYLKIRANGVDVGGATSLNSNAISLEDRYLCASVAFRFAIGGSFSVIVFQDSGGALNADEILTTVTRISQ